MRFLTVTGGTDNGAGIAIAAQELLNSLLVDDIMDDGYVSLGPYVSY